MLSFLSKIYKPSHYHGNDKNDNFFEGWFFKMVDPKGDNIFAVIPGVYISKNKEKEHSFIQLLDGKTHESHYIRFNFNEFYSENDKFEITIGDSKFSEDLIYLNISEQDLLLKGELKFTDIKPWPVTLLSPGIMGWYSFVPYMECNHGVVSLNHGIEGTLVYNNKEINFTGGKGYIEKDWGSSFPSSYVWMQSNHFENKKVSFTGSVARIPWRKSWFRGFIVGLLTDEKLFRFATYTGAKLSYLNVDDKHIKYEIIDRKYKIEILAIRTQGGKLHAPYENEMLERVSESLDGEVNVKLSEKKSNKVIFEGTGIHSGIEANGNLKEIIDN